MALDKLQDEMLALSGVAAKAWVYFNGTGTVAKNGDYNVTSITDNGVGLYTLNFTQDLPSVDYSATILCGQPGVTTGFGSDVRGGASDRSVGTFAIGTYNTSNALTDMSRVSVIVFSN